MNNYITHTLNGVMVSQRNDDGYLNATMLAKAYQKASGKRRDVHDWLRTKRTSESIQHLSTSTGISVDLLVVIIKDGPNELRGTYIHPRLAVRFAIWLSDEFGYQVEFIIEQWVKDGLKPQRDENWWRDYHRKFMPGRWQNIIGRVNCIENHFQKVPMTMQDHEIEELRDAMAKLEEHLYPFEKLGLRLVFGVTAP